MDQVFPGEALALVLATLLLLTPFALAHSLHLDHTLEPPRVLLHASYGGGAPAAEAYLSIYSPGDMPELFVSGNSDAEGRFAFEPDRPGRWSAVVDDGYGHRTTIAISLPENWATGGAEPSGPRPSAPRLPLRFGLGLTIIVLLSVFLILAARRRARRRTPR